MKKKIVVLSGAGISAESGIKTFRDAGGLWEGYDVMDVASPEGWNKNQELVLSFYNERRKQLKNVTPNQGHKSLVELEQWYEVVIVTQNVDDLHERAGSSNIIHLHGELLKSRSINRVDTIFDCETDIVLGDLAPDGYQLRPHIVWFGEMVPMIERAAQEVADAHIIIVVGTSMQVYPAAGLVGYAPLDAEIYYVDPSPNISQEMAIRNNFKIIKMPATKGIPYVSQLLRNKK